MSSQPLGQVLRHIRKLIGSTEVSAPDAALLERFASARDEQAFEQLVDRHANLVYSVCRRVLDDEQDAADAFQATFFVLARKAGSIRKQASVSSWLYGVAFRVARKVRAKRSRRRTLEKQVIPMDIAATSAVPFDDLRGVLDEELNRLPPKYRDPLVLCYLQGQTHEQAARALGWPSGTMSRRIGRALGWLRQRLTSRGITLSSAVLATALVDQKLQAAAPSALLAETTRSAVLYASGTSLTGAAALLADETVHGLFLAKLRHMFVLALGVALVGTTAGVLYHAHRVETPNAAPPAADHGELVARLDATIDAFQPTPAERKIDRIGWARDLPDAERLARAHGRPVFLFSHGGSIATGRCGGSAFNLRANGLADDRVIARLNRSFVPVFASAGGDEGSGKPPPADRGEVSRLYHAALAARLKASDECMYLLSSDGVVRDVVSIGEAKNNPDRLLERLDRFAADQKAPDGEPVVPPAPLSVAPARPPGGIVLHLVARIGHHKPWSEFPAENWLVLSQEQTERLLRGALTRPGESWLVEPTASAEILTYFYPQTENNDVDTNRLDIQELRATVVSAEPGRVRARLDGRLLMKHRFYPSRDDDSMVEATLIGALDFDPATHRVLALRLVTEHGSYAGHTFKAVLRSVP
jgi:RNA polymerase sigma factor (sigma-70 family)